MTLTVKLPVVSRSASRCSAGLQVVRSARVPAPPLPARRAADLDGGFQPREVSGGRFLRRQRFQKVRERFQEGNHRLSRPCGHEVRQPTGTLAPRRSGSEIHGGAFAADLFRRARRLMRQTEEPTKIPAKTAPTRGESFARRAGNRIGWAPRIASRPSPHPRIRWTVASPGRAARARRAMRPPPPRAPTCPTNPTKC